MNTETMSANFGPRWIIKGNGGKRLRRIKIKIFVPKPASSMSGTPSLCFETYENGERIMMTPVDPGFHDKLLLSGWFFVRTVDTDRGQEHFYERPDGQ
jgi:hypothetical protein